MPRTHKTLPRLFLDAPLMQGGAVALDKDQTNYLLNVLRRRSGDAVVVFNGRDGAFLAAIEQLSKKTVGLSLGERTAAQTAPSDLWYGFAPLKSARLDYVVQKATEMGAGIIQPVITRHTQLTRINLDRLRANAREAAEQCEVLSIPRIDDEIGLRELLATWQDIHGDRQLVFADEGEEAASPVAALAAIEGRRIGLLIGPEGGFSDDERELLRAQAFVVPISLGPRILRADTAAVAALAVIQSIIGDWR
ncbi:MAG TPA: 16S rRNA (uracil(1498)-N(3))-methyltransferase [Devosiaceae bacterium]